MMTMWLPDIAGRAGPKYLAIADAIGEAVADGTLAAGSKLPPQRNLAYDIGVTLGTVTRAYREAERRGLVGGEVGRGTFITAGRRRNVDGFIDFEPKTPDILDLTHATMPVPEAGEFLARTLREIADDDDISALTDYQLNTGLHRHLASGARWITSKGVDSSANRIAMSGGVQHGVMAAIIALTRPGDAVMVESLTYPGVIQMGRHLGYRLEPVAMDHEGLLPDALDEACRRTSARVLYCMPTVHNPTTATMSVGRREAVSNVARRHGLLVIEDDVWAAVGPGHPPPLASFIPERTLFITSPAKCMAGGLRVGYIHCPENQVHQVRSAVRMSSWMTAPLMAEVTARWLESDIGATLTTYVRGEIRSRVQLAEERLRGFDLRADPSVSFVWLSLPAPWRATDFQAEANARGVRILTAETFAAGRELAPHAVRLSVGGNHTEAQIAKALDTLLEILRAPPGVSASIM